MSFNDTLQRFMFEGAGIRGELVHLDAAWRAVLERHDYPPGVRGPLGEMMAASVLLAATLKFEGSIILQIQGDGPINLMVVECTSRRTVRGMAQWKGEVPEGDLKSRFGGGRFAITIDPGHGAKRYQGIVALSGETLADALDEYLERSEQLSTRMWLVADETRAAGLLLQKLPGDAPGGEQGDDWNRIAMLGSTITGKELLELSPGELIRRLFHEEDVRVFDPEPVSFRCSCSRERISGILRGLGHEEVMDIIKSEGAVEAVCEFCNRQYRFDLVDSEQLFADQPQPEIKPTRH